MAFVHLRAHTECSMLDGLILTKEDKKKRPNKSSLAMLAQASQQSAVAMTDLNGMFGAIQFYQDARNHGVKPILGADINVEPDVTQAGEQQVSDTRMVLLAKDEDGYRRLMALLSRAQLENQREHVAYVKQSWFQEGTEGLIALSGDGSHGELAQLFKEGMTDVERAQAESVVGFYQSVFPGRYYLEVQRYDQPNEAIQVAETAALSAYTGVPLVATHPIQFEKREDFFIHEVRSCIADKTIVDEIGRPLSFTREQYFKSSDEMAELFADLPEALENAEAVSRLCTSPLLLNKPQLPRFDSGTGEGEEELLARLSWEGLESRLLHDFPDAAVREAVRGEYEQRLDYELSVINRMGFPGYFLIVADFIGWAKDNGIPIGPGRGSGAGSLVAHSLRITNLDPIQHGLLFERFLNPDRVSMPDFDIDMDIFRRGEIIDYVRQKYGSAAVSQISTLTVAAAKGAVLNVVRTMGLPVMLGRDLSKMIPDTPGTSLRNVLSMEGKLKSRYDSDPQARRVLDLALALEGTATTVGKHAAGVLISPKTITDFSPLYMRTKVDTANPEDEAGVVSQFHKDDVETAGLVKFDFLGLANLSIVDFTQKLINERADFQEVPFDIETIPLDDAEVYRLFATGDTVGVFQFESSGMRGTLRQAVPERFEDLVALNALFRPGPMDLIPSYCRRKHGLEEVEYPDPRVEEVLKDTYGIMVYQEQVMQVAQILGGYSLGGADLLRRAMGKKKPEEMAKHREIFKEGAAKNGIAEDKALELFDLIEMFSGYGFNKSHAAAYSLVAYQTAYLKHHFPSEFYVASMNVAALQKGAKTQTVIEKMLADARLHGIQVLPPDINVSEGLFSAESSREIRYGLLGLKEVGEPVVNRIIQTRQEKGEFESFFDFFRKMGRGFSPKRVSDSLVRSGAFDSLHPNRAALLASVPAGVKYAAALAKESAATGSVADAGLFGGAAPSKPKAAKSAAVEPLLEVVPEWSPREKLEEERKAIGYYLSAHPFDVYAAQLQGIPGALPLSRLEEAEPGSKKSVLVAGIIQSVRENTTRNGDKMAYLVLSDGQESRDVTVFPKTYEAHANLLKEKEFIALEARVERDDRSEELPWKLLAQDAWGLEAFEAYQARSVHVALRKEDLPRLRALADKPRAIQGEWGLKTMVYIPINDDHYYRATVNLGLTNTVDTLRDLRDEFGADKVKLGLATEMVFRQRFAPKPNRGNRPGDRNR